MPQDQYASYPSGAPVAGYAVKVNANGGLYFDSSGGGGGTPAGNNGDMQKNSSNAFGVAVAGVDYTKPIVIDGSTGAVITANQANCGPVIKNTGQGSVNVNNTLPAASEGMSLMAIVMTASANYWRFTPNAGDVIYLDGSVVGKSWVEFLTPAFGNALSFIGVTGGWFVSTVSGTSSTN